LFHIDLNDQEPGRFDQDFRFGAADIKGAFFLVKLLEDHKYRGFKHFDAHAYRTSDRADSIEFARGCMRTYLILKEKARAWRADARIREILRQINRPGKEQSVNGYTAKATNALLRRSFDRDVLAAKALPYEALDQRTMEILLGVG
jgi:xylose isomerase